MTHQANEQDEAGQPAAVKPPADFQADFRTDFQGDFQSEDQPETQSDAASPRVADVSGSLEALLLMATEPMPTVVLAEALGTPVARVEAALGELTRFYDESGRGFELRQVGGGWRYYTRPEHAPVINRYVLEGQHGRLTQAALETLAVIAYLQPATRSRISAVRGVNVDGVVRTLLARDLIVETARDELSGAALFATTPYFLERMGMSSLDELPPLAPHLPDAMALEAELADAARGAELPPDGPTPDPIGAAHPGGVPSHLVDSQWGTA